MKNYRKKQYKPKASKKNKNYSRNEIVKRKLVKKHQQNQKLFFKKIVELINLQPS